VVQLSLSFLVSPPCQLTPIGLAPLPLSNARRNERYFETQPHDEIEKHVREVNALRNKFLEDRLALLGYNDEGVNRCRENGHDSDPSGNCRHRLQETLAKSQQLYEKIDGVELTEEEAMLELSQFWNNGPIVARPAPTPTGRADLTYGPDPLKPEERYTPRPVHPAVGPQGGYGISAPIPSAHGLAAQTGMKEQADPSAPLTGPTSQAQDSAASPPYTSSWRGDTAYRRSCNDGSY
jgi:hypothetical protein